MVDEAQRRVLGGPTLALWVVLLAALPFYVFDSGLPQPADIGLAIFLGGIALARFGELDGELRGSVNRLVQYVLWVVIVNTAWVQIAGFERGFLFSTAFAVFNATVFVGFLAFARQEPERVLRITANTMALTLVGQAALAVARPDMADGLRLILYFNNPNQLAYYCLGALTVVLVIHGRIGLRRSLVVVAAFGAGFVIYKSYSRAALGGYLLLCLVPFVRRPQLILAMVIPIAVAGALVDASLSEDPLWQVRIDQAASQTVGDYLEDRGVERLVQNPEYLLLGSGEGMHQRFHHFGLELHSSFAGVIFYYGVPGVLLLVLFFWSIVNRMSMSARAYLAPMIVYSIFHNGMRFRMFWIALAVFATLNSLRDRKIEEPGPRVAGLAS